MTTRTLALAGLVLGTVGLGAKPATANEEYRHGYLRHVEAGVTLQRATEVVAEEAVPNLPFLPGDRVWTDAEGRVELRFPDGSAVRLDRRSKLDYASHDEGRDETIVLRLWSGSLILRNRTGQLSSFEVETPGGLVRVSGRGVFRIDAAGGETWLSVYEGVAALDTGRDRIEVGAGERVRADWGGSVSGPEGFDRYALDDFAGWDGELEARESWTASGRRYLPEELDPYAAELDTYGSWAYEPTAGYVWRPTVAAGWVPYTNGYWAWTPSYGYSWVAYEPWGWAPFHYGRWGFSVSLGWYWSPGRVWGPGWVSWWVGGGYVGWCPLGRHGRPVTPWSRYRGHAVPRSSIGHGYRGHAVPRGSVDPRGGWSIVRSGDLGRRDVARRRVAMDAGSLGSVRIAETGRERPSRNGLALAEATSPTRSMSRRPRPAAATRTLPASPGTTGRPAGGNRATPMAPGSPSRRGSPGATLGARPRSGEGSRSTPGSAAPSSPRERRVPGVGFSRPRTGTSSPRRETARPTPSSSPNERQVPGVGSSRPRSGSSRPGTAPRNRQGGETRVAPRSSGSGNVRSRPSGLSSSRSSGRDASASPSRSSSSGSSVRPRTPPSSSTPSRSSTSRSGASRPSPRSIGSGVSSRRSPSGSASRSSPSRSSPSRPSASRSSSRSSSSRSSGSRSSTSPSRSRPKRQ